MPLRLRSRLTAKHAVSLDHTNVMAHTALGLVASYLAHHGEFELSLPLARRAIELNPHPPSWLHFPSFAEHFLHGRFEPALELA